MAFTKKVLLFCSLLLLISPSMAQKSSSPKALLLPVTKDPSTLQYTTQINQRTPLVTIKLAIDLGAQFLWVDTERNYVSSSYKPAHCGSTVCSLAMSQACGDCFDGPKPGCNNNTCGLFPAGPTVATGGEVALDVVSIQSTDGKNPGKSVSVPDVVFVTGSTFLLEGLARGVTGMVGLGRSNISLPQQFSDAFGFNGKFAICLSSSSKSNGVIFFGDKPYVMSPGVDISKSLKYTPLILNPVSTAGSSFEGDPSTDYFIGLKSIKIELKDVVFNKALLSIDSEGRGGTMISTMIPYTTMETTIYKAFVSAYIKAAANKRMTRVKAVAPFGACFDSSSIGDTKGRVGPAVPEIDLVFQRSSVSWRIYGANSMVRVSSDVMCLGFVDGGSSPRTSIVIGGNQLEDNLLQFDLVKSTLGFSNTLLMQQTTCSNFNFTSTKIRGSLFHQTSDEIQKSK